MDQQCPKSSALTDDEVAHFTSHAFLVHHFLLGGVSLSVGVSHCSGCEALRLVTTAGRNCMPLFPTLKQRSAVCGYTSASLVCHATTEVYWGKGVSYGK